MSDIFPKPTNIDSIITISNLANQKNIYNRNPPYQRGDVWTDDWKKALIHSILNGLPLAPITLVQRDDDNGEQEFLVLDGKQRLSAVFDFIEDKFRITLSFGDKTISLSYSEIIQKAKDKKYEFYAQLQKYYTAFRNYNFKAVIYPNISWHDQISLFRQINHSKELSKFDKFNSNYIFAKSYADFIFETYIPEMNNFIINKFKGTSATGSGQDLFYKFRFLGVLMNQDLENPTTNTNNFPPVQVGRKNTFQKFMSNLDKKVNLYMVKKDDQYLFSGGNKDRVENMLSEFEWENLISNSKSLNKIFPMVDGFCEATSKRKKYVYVLTYFSFFLLEKIQDQSFTHNMLEQKKDIFKKIFNEYYDWTNEDGERIRRACDAYMRSEHFTKIKQLIDDSELDLGKKYTTFTKDEVRQIVRDAGGKCEICKSNEKLEIDHVEPASLSSAKIGGLLCETCNRRKSDNTPESLQSATDYIARKTG